MSDGFIGKTTKEDKKSYLNLLAVNTKLALKRAIISLDEDNTVHILEPSFNSIEVISSLTAGLRGIHGDNRIYNFCENGESIMKCSFDLDNFRVIILPSNPLERVTVNITLEDKNK